VRCHLEKPPDIPGEIMKRKCCLAFALCMLPFAGIAGETRGLEKAAKAQRHQAGPAKQGIDRAVHTSTSRRPIGACFYEANCPFTEMAA